jgi:hypothetical protein
MQLNEEEILKRANELYREAKWKKELDYFKQRKSCDSNNPEVLKRLRENFDASGIRIVSDQVTSIVQALVEAINEQKL